MIWSDTPAKVGANGSHWQTEEQLHWSFGTGLKNSIDNLPTFYFRQRALAA
jgi:hypothetical protein